MKHVVYIINLSSLCLNLLIMFKINYSDRVVMLIGHNDDLHHKIFSLVCGLPWVLGNCSVNKLI
jgi:hypothetical protein